MRERKDFYFMMGDGRTNGRGKLQRLWEDAYPYKFVSAGGSKKFSYPLKTHINKGDRVWVYIPKHGYVGAGEVTELAASYKEIKEIPLDKLKGHYQKDKCNSDEDCEYFVRVEWLGLTSGALEKAVHLSKVAKVGGLYYRNFFCHITPKHKTYKKWMDTLEYLKKEFKI